MSNSPAAIAEASPTTPAAPLPAAPALPAELPILLELPAVRIVLDALGALALFTSAAIALSPHDAVAVTGVVGALVLVARAVRSVRATST